MLTAINFLKNTNILVIRNQAYREPLITELINKYDRFQLLLHENCWSDNGDDFRNIYVDQL